MEEVPIARSVLELMPVSGVPVDARRVARPADSPVCRTSFCVCGRPAGSGQIATIRVDAALHCAASEPTTGEVLVASAAGVVSPGIMDTWTRTEGLGHHDGEDFP
ncbi:hypothetical protein [Streptomyces sp. YPW6]|uniref:hypothetical protein n=1 Tax=Streptomyces sp. YPW6 TaxID=2840373 RepID=UPI003D726577